MPDIGPAIESNATGLKSVTTDAGTVSSQPIGDQIKADQYLAGKAAVAAAANDGQVLNRVFRFGRAVPPGSV
jgi:hypothetical protein